VTAATVLDPFDPATLLPADPAPGSLVNAIESDPEALVYFLLNVGDGDSQVVLLPPDSNDGVRRLLIVDVATSGKVPALLDSLHAHKPDVTDLNKGLLTEPPGSSRQIRLLVVTHPHADHMRGVPDLLDRYNGTNGCIDQFWDPGFYFPTPMFHTLMAQLEASPWIRRLQPTSGTTCYFDDVKVTVVGPGVGLRMRFDTYGVEINDSSLTLMVEFPAGRVYTESDPDKEGRADRKTARDSSRRLLLGADAQFTSWAQATVDFPDLHSQRNPVLATELRAARGRDYMAAEVFKLSHHASKHGVNLELLERVAAQTLLVSSGSGGGSYNFPHLLAMEAARESRQSTTTSGAPRKTDHELGIHCTGGTLNDTAGTPLGSIAIVVPRWKHDRLRMFRLMDDRRGIINLSQSREVAP